MSIRGKLSKSSMGDMMPAHAEPLNFTTASFREVDQVTFTYRTDTEAAAALLPADLEVDENPLISVLFVSYAISSVGPFREFIQTITARFRDEEVGYVPHIYITNERGMLAGREREGLPKLLGNIDFDMRRVTTEGLVTPRVSRPSDITLAQGVFRPSEVIGQISPDSPTIGKLMGLRVIGSPVPGGPLSICELVPSAIEYSSGEIWSGDGSLVLTGASELSPVHRLPIVGGVQATALRNASFRLVRPTQTYPIDA
jgi:acetoacetate decarboxylase